MTDSIEGNIEQTQMNVKGATSELSKAVTYQVQWQPCLGIRLNNTTFLKLLYKV